MASAARDPVGAAQGGFGLAAAASTGAKGWGALRNTVNEQKKTALASSPSKGWDLLEGLGTNAKEWTAKTAKMVHRSPEAKIFLWRKEAAEWLQDYVPWIGGWLGYLFKTGSGVIFCGDLFPEDFTMIRLDEVFIYVRGYTKSSTVSVLLQVLNQCRRVFGNFFGKILVYCRNFYSRNTPEYCSTFRRFFFFQPPAIWSVLARRWRSSINPCTTSGTTRRPRVSEPTTCPTS